jgi:hypothetical protein
MAKCLKSLKLLPAGSSRVGNMGGARGAREPAFVAVAPRAASLGHLKERARFSLYKEK